jgi:hypothetical protein
MKFPDGYWYLIIGEIQAKYAHVTDYDDLNPDFNFLDLKRATPYEADLDDQILLKTNFPNRPLSDFIVNPFDWPLVSQDAWSKLQSHATINAQWLPITLFDQAGNPIQQKFGVLNLLDVYDCIDVSKSKFRLDSDNAPDGFMDISIDPARVGPASIFKFSSNAFAEKPHIDFKAICPTSFLHVIKRLNLKGMGFLKTGESLD